MPRRYLSRPNRSDYMSIKEIANLVDMHPNTVRSWIWEGLLPYTTGIKGEYLIRRRDLRKFMAKYYNEELPENE